jgi:hypothetical protein
MATYYVEGKVDLMILVDDYGNTKITEKCLSYMFGFLCGCIHVSRDDAYDDNNVVKIQYTGSLFQILMGSIGMSRQGGIGLLVTT